MIRRGEKRGSIHDEMSGFRRISDGEYGQMAKDFGLEGLPYRDTEKLKMNAGFVPPRWVKGFLKYIEDRTGVEGLKTDLGLIASHPSLKNLPIMAHELGHAKIHNDGGLGRFNQEWLRPLGPAAAALGAFTLPGAMKTAPRAGLGAAGLMLAGNVPTLLSESKATDHAKHYMREIRKVTDALRQQKEDMLDRAYGTYQAKAVGSAGVMGLVTALAKALR